MPKLTQEQLIAKYDAMYEYENDCFAKGYKMIGGIDGAVYPRPRSFILGAKLNF